MRSVSLGQWLYFAWHLPTVLLSLAALAVAVYMARSLARDSLSPRARYLRWSVIGWSGVLSSLLCAVAWPYLQAVARVDVDAEGAWHLRNYLGFELARVGPGEVRTIRAYDLGGMRLGSGHLEFALEGAPPIESVRVGASAFARLCETLGYGAEMQRESFGSVVIPAHRFSTRGPTMTRSVASR